MFDAESPLLDNIPLEIMEFMTDAGEGEAEELDEDASSLPSNDGFTLLGVVVLFWCWWCLRWTFELLVAVYRRSGTNMRTRASRG